MFNDFHIERDCLSLKKIKNKKTGQSFYLYENSTDKTKFLPGVIFGVDCFLLFYKFIQNYPDHKKEFEKRALLCAKKNPKLFIKRYPSDLDKKFLMEAIFNLHGE